VRQIPRQDRAVRAGVWDRYLAWPRWHLHDQVLGLVGFGRIARAVVEKLAGFRLRVLAHDPRVPPEVVAAHGARSVSLDELLAAADFVSIHCPLEPSTRHLLDERALRRMKPSAVVINTARGPIIDEAALARALRDGWIAAAGLDVLEDEPPRPDNPLLALDNVVLTPHIAGYSDEYLDNSWRLSMETAIDLANGRRPRSVVNPSVQPRWSLQ
jgi:D-3-phosphoglycerate dehydrogenase